jgi:hypothetical protein
VNPGTKSQDQREGDRVSVPTKPEQNGGATMNHKCVLIGNGKLFQNRLSEVNRHASTLAREISQFAIRRTLVAYAPPLLFLSPVAEAFKRVSNVPIELASQAVSSRRHEMDTGVIDSPP